MLVVIIVVCYLSLTVIVDVAEVKKSNFTLMEDYSRKATATKPMKDAKFGVTTCFGIEKCLIFSGLVFLGPIFPSKSVQRFIYLYDKQKSDCSKPGNHPRCIQKPRFDFADWSEGNRYSLIDSVWVVSGSRNSGTRRSNHQPPLLHHLFQFYLTWSSDCHD
ncbi:MAG: hypothetical protein CM1200mP24_08270 [Gammaproteobacteria bacterium]|nr:MAG: hypothetical protein CM1200mP24_08270 [Gammaproteobacteria bacterium]